MLPRVDLYKEHPYWFEVFFPKGTTINDCSRWLDARVLGSVKNAALDKHPYHTMQIMDMDCLHWVVDPLGPYV